MRIALLVTDLERGGTPLRIARLARGLSRAGIEVNVGCLAPPGPVGRDLESEGIPTFSCDARSPRDVFALRRLARHVRRFEPDLVHATLTHANVAARIVGDWVRVPVVTSTATIEVERRWHLKLELCTASMDRGHIVNSQALAVHVANAFRLSASRIHVVPPLLDALPGRSDRGAARRRLGLSDETFVVLWAGRFDPVKRLDVVIRCAEIMTEPRWDVVLAGDGPARDQIEDLARSSSAKQRIHLIGWQDDLAPALSAADAFLFPSLTEGMPNAVLQAMAFGLPIVGSNIPALRELAGDDQRALLVDGHDANRFAAALQRLRQNEGLREGLGRRAADWVRVHLDPDNAVSATIAVYEHVLEQRA